MNTSTFQSLVEADVRNQCSPDKSEALRSPRNALRWEEGLKKIKKSVESQLGAKRDEIRKARLSMSEQEWRDEYVEFAKWRAGAKRFLGAVEERVMEAGTLHRENELQRLKDAIHAHRVWMTEKDFDPSAADEKLWDTVN